MDEGRRVDLLLVRLRREDEKRKVIDLLVGELGMTEEEALEKVENSPGILRENVEMEQGRILQDRMYPFVDLLPRYYGSRDPKPAEPSEPPETIPPSTEEPAGPEEDIEIQHGVYTDDEEVVRREEEDDGEDIGIVYDSIPTSEDEFRPPPKEEIDDSFVITSASEEVLTVERCHICGRTPTVNEKLVPCRTCEALTCADCYNRKEHVCEKCASMGRTVDRPLDSVPQHTESRPAAGPAVRTAGTTHSRASGRARRAGPSISWQSPPVLAAIAVLVLGTLFLILDPLGIRGSTDESVETALPADGENGHGVAPDGDTLEPFPPDTLSGVDTLAVHEPLSLRNMVLPDTLMSVDSWEVPPAVTRVSISGPEVLIDSIPYMSEPIGRLAALHSVRLDGFSLIRSESGHYILVMTILHPEPAERRAALLGGLGAILDSTAIDQMVLYYRENQYYEPNIFSFISDSFPALSMSVSPYFLQRKQGWLPETSELITERVFDWMTNPGR